MERRPLKILQLAKFYTPHRGGIETVVETLSKGLKERGLEVDLLCFASLGQKTVRQFNVIICSIGANFFSQPLSWSYIFYFLKNKKKYNLFHIHSPNLLAEFLASIFLWKKKYVVSFHSDVLGKGWLGKLSRVLTFYSLYRANRIFVSSSEYIEGSPLLPFFRDKITVIPFGVFDFSKEKTTQSLELPTKFDLFVGRLVEYKGIGYLVSAIEKSQTNLVIVGVGPLEKVLKKAVEERKLTNKITFLGNLEHKSLIEVYKRANSLILPSIDRRESFGVTLIEAMSFGVPIITTKINTGVDMISQDGYTGVVVPPKNSEELARGILFLQNLDKRSQFSKNARKRYECFFTEKTMSKTYHYYLNKI